MFYSIDKCPIPIIWLDTSVMINLTKFFNNSEKLNDSDRSRISKLYPLLKQCALEGKCIIPFFEQGVEIVGEDNQRKFFDSMKNITFFLMTKSELDIEIIQLRAAMSGYIKNTSSITISYRDIFDDDPIIEIKNVLSNPILISPSYCPIVDGAHDQNIKKNLLKTLNEERLRNRNNHIDD